ncbi:hypothetical protein [Bifidobacterium choerinum]|uniref:hypothetical protein n=2 Tax=Bifidobacterium choerinum TaxID=35760 RepID=UPI00041E5DB2|nr:hypothetical protein [Bifidobacterium choerinum]
MHIGDARTQVVLAHVAHVDAVDEHASPAGSWKRIASEATVDLPEPVAPMMATVSPVRTVKLT